MEINNLEQQRTREHLDAKYEKGQDQRRALKKIMGWSYEPIEMEDYFSGSSISLEQMQQEIESLEKKVSHCTEERKEYLFKIFKTHLEYLCTY